MESKNKYYDDILNYDKKGEFLIEYTSQCFNQCVPNITYGALNSDEKKCFVDCYTKGYYTFTQGENLFK